MPTVWVLLICAGSGSTPIVVAPVRVQTPGADVRVRTPHSAP